ncbi:helix-turn-helix transcriptional regulator [Nocardioides terrisoli]|uniref:helix-turn-helix transcriptional regulator n=1 Tax=Nocardioides terrisoli TaxID=3388267 RepID=UPI00287BB7CF|nr:LuxR C-terminal-related transcriptional regulator [Nocardioides marmorisolisilvae]
MTSSGNLGDELPLLARDEEFRVLRRVLDQGLSGARRPYGVVMVAGAGVGKSRLLREALQYAGAQGAPTALVIGTGAAASSPYGAFAHLATGLPPDDHDAAYAWYLALAESLRASDGRPAVLGVDDAHLLDDGSADLLLHLTASGAANVLVTVRRGADAPDSITTLWKDEWALRLDLQTFSLSETEKFIETQVHQATGGEIEARACIRLAQISGGNALFARELVLNAFDSGSLRPVDGVWRWDGTLEIAPRLADAVALRLGELDEGALDALALVALGEPIGVPVAVQVASESALTALERRGLVTVDDVGDGQCRLAHPLYGEVALDRVGSVCRRRLRRELADVLARDPQRTEQDLVRVARWRLELGEPVAAEMLAGAAQVANRSFDHRLARHLARAAVDSGAGPAAAVSMAEAANGCREFDEAEQVLAAAEEAILRTEDDHVKHAYVAVRLTALQRGLGRFADSHAVLDRFEHMPADGEDTASLRRRGLTAAAHRSQLLLDEGRLAELLVITGPVLREPDAAGPLATLTALASEAEAYAYLGDTVVARKRHDQMLEMARTGSPEVRSGGSWATSLQVLTLIVEGRLVEANALATLMRDYTVNIPDPTVRALAALVLGSVQLKAGAVATARRTLLDAVSGFGESEISEQPVWASALLAQAQALLGNTESARVTLDKVHDLQRPTPVSRTVADVVTAQALVEFAEGDSCRAVQTALSGADAVGELTVHRARLLHLAVRVGAAAGSVRVELERLADQTPCRAVLRRARQVTALATGDGPGLAQLAEEYAEAGSLLLAAESAAQAARVHAHAGAHTLAARLASRSQSLAKRCEGARTLTMLPRDDTRPALSRREHDVARLAADGLSNTEISERLTLSVRTVESHLHHAFTKLGVTRRSQLAGNLAQDPGQIQYSSTEALTSSGS